MIAQAQSSTENLIRTASREFSETLTYHFRRIADAAQAGWSPDCDREIERAVEGFLRPLQWAVANLEQRLLSETPKEAPSVAPEEEDDGLTSEERRWLAVARGQAA